MQQLLPKFIDMVATDPELQGKIAKVTGKSVQAVLVWGKRPNHERLIMKPVLTAISEYTNTKEEDLLMEVA